MQVAGAEVTVYRVQDPVRPDNSSDFDEGVLEAPAVSVQVFNQQTCKHVSRAQLRIALKWTAKFKDMMYRQW